MQPANARTSDRTPILIKRYADTRFYDTEHGRYVALADIADMTRDGCSITVQDAKTGDDITRKVMSQAAS